MNRNLIVVIALFGCGPADRNRGDDPDANLGGEGNNGGGDGTNGDGCSDAAKLIYVIDSNNTMSQFNPPAKAFTDLGQLNCPALADAKPFSMGVDRNAIAWVLFASMSRGDGELFRVDTKAGLACTKAAWQPGTDGHKLFGMGFSTETAGGTIDSLFIAGGDGPPQQRSKLAKLDMGSFQPTTVATVAGYPELTGTGNAELWGFFPNAFNTRVVKLDKTTGMAAKTFPLPSLNGGLNGAAWAFAFHGGDFWIFWKRGAEQATTVYQMNGMTGAITSMTPTNTRTIVGAGVSTCAPVVIL